MIRRAWIFICVAFSVAGCSTFVSSQRDDPEGRLRGVRYSLPVPFLVIMPKADGTLETTIEYLPDPDHTYVLNTHSVVSSYTLDVATVNQILSSVSLSGASDAVAAQLAQSAGSVAAARIQARNQEATAAETEATAAAAAAAQQAQQLAAAEVEVDIAAATLTALQQAGITGDRLLDAQIKLREVTIRRDALLAAANAALNLASANAPGGGATAYGPMLFRIYQDPDGDVRLVAVDGPTRFPTSAAAGAPEPDVTLRPAGQISIVRTNGQLSVELTYSRRIDHLGQLEIVSAANPTTTIAALRPSASFTDEGAGSKITIRLNPATPAGSYRILLPITDKDSVQEVARQIDVIVP